MPEDKATLWAKLTAKWADYKEREKHSSIRSDFKQLESEIEQLQKDLGVYDKPDQFEIRWNNKKVESQPVQVVKDASQTLGEEKRKLLQKFADEAIAEECFIANYLLTKNPDLSKNPAKLGQLINQTWIKYNGVKNG